MRRLPLRAERTARIARWLFVGNLVEAKGVRRLVRSFARWASAHADRPCALTLAGDGPLRGELAQLAAELGVGDRVHFLGRVEPDAVGEVYRGHDVLVHLSHGETFGLTWALRRRHHVRGAGEHPPRTPRRRLGCLRARGRRGRRGVGV